MKRAHWLYVAAFSLMTTPVFAEMTGNINGFLGQKILDDGDWGRVDQQGELGLMFDIRDNNWPISIAVDLLGSADTADTPSGEITGATAELDIGVRKVFDINGSSLHPYVGGGLALVGADLERDVFFGTVSDDDTGTGYWVSAGIYWRFANNLNLGMDARYSNADLDLFGANVDAGGTHLGAVIGYHW